MSLEKKRLKKEAGRKEVWLRSWEKRTEEDKVLEEELEKMGTKPDKLLTQILFE